MSQLIEGKCLRCASFLSKPQKTCTIPKVAEVTGSEKSPPVYLIRYENFINIIKYIKTHDKFKSIYRPGGDTAPTMETEPSRSGFPKHLTRPARS